MRTRQERLPRWNARKRIVGTAQMALQTRRSRIHMQRFGGNHARDQEFAKGGRNDKEAGGDGEADCESGARSIEEGCASGVSGAEFGASVFAIFSSVGGVFEADGDVQSGRGRCDLFG